MGQGSIKRREQGSWNLRLDSLLTQICRKQCIFCFVNSRKKIHCFLQICVKTLDLVIRSQIPTHLCISCSELPVRAVARVQIQFSTQGCSKIGRVIHPRLRYPATLNIPWKLYHQTDPRGSCSLWVEATYRPPTPAIACTNSLWK